ncbi:MAG: carbon-nitrogen hydrolase family protein [Oscillospiraceae bacterium]|nr:carbon-nitrogen hydrolase family protein [Oscillospiraceae bacterium]
MVLKIAFIQLLGSSDPDVQLSKGIEGCRRAKELGADIALFPEMWSDGYTIPQDAEELRALAVTADSVYVDNYRQLASELDMAIAATFLEQHEPGPLNSVMLFDRHGNEVLHYSKLHTCAFDAEAVLDGGDDLYTADLDTGKGIVKVGSMICFDREFPESARILMLKGAEVILAPNACPMEINRLSALRTRAYENMLAVATCNYPSPHPDCNGRSTIFDGVAWLREEPSSRDMCVFEAPSEDGVYVGQIDMDMLRDYREHEIMGHKYRHPEKYGILTERRSSC